MRERKIDRARAETKNDSLLDNVFEKNFMVFRIYSKSSIKSCRQKVNPSLLQIQVSEHSTHVYLCARKKQAFSSSTSSYDEEISLSLVSLSEMKQISVYAVKY